MGASARDFGIYGIYMQMPLRNIHADISSKARGLIFFYLSLHLHPYFMYMSSKGSGQTLHMHRPAWAFPNH